MTLDEMYATPGYYRVHLTGTLYVNVFCQEAGKVFQLTPVGEVDDELPRVRWHGNPKIFIADNEAPILLAKLRAVLKAYEQDVRENYRSTLARSGPFVQDVKRILNHG